MTTDEAAGLGAILGISVTMMLIITVAMFVIYVIAFYKLFDKAGEAGWKAIIPFYNAYIQFKITWEAKYFWILLALSFVYGICTSIDPYSETVVALIGGVCGLAAAVIAIMDLWFLSKSYGHGGGYFAGLLFLPYIFTLILGFGSSQYFGPKGEGYQQQQLQQ